MSGQRADANPWEVAAQRFEPTQADRWLQDPVAWAIERAGVEPWSKQQEVMAAVRDNRRVAVHSCHGVGKTHIAAHVAGWFIDVHPPGQAFVLTTAPSAPQVKAILWREINRMHERSGLKGRTNLTEWYIDGKLVAFGRKPSDYNDSAFQGIHDRWVLVVMDEACGVPANLWVAAEAVTTNVNGRILAIGNPDSNDGEFAKKCRPDTTWETIHIGYDSTPNFTGEQISPELAEQLISVEWVEDMRQQWGEDSALFQSKVLGIFPTEGSDPWRTVPSGWALACQNLQFPEGEPVEAGIDVGAGGDRTVVFERRGKRAGRHVEFRDSDPMASVGRIAQTLNDWGIQRAKIDVIGVGWGLSGRLKELSSRHNPTGHTTHSTEIVGVNFAERSSSPRRFLNRRAEVWWNVGRENSRLRLWDLTSLTDDVIAELAAPRYEIVDSSGKVKIESKDQVIKRLGRSPDMADAVLLAFFEGVSAKPADTSSVSVFRNANLAAGSGGSTPFGQGMAGSGNRTVFGN